MAKTDHSKMVQTNFFEAFGPETSAGVPKYQQVRFAVIEAIRNGYWKKGAKIPTEEELIEVTGFSLGTVQRAVRMLAEDGVLSRRQGSGTFVSRASSRISEPWHFQFLAEDGETLLPVYPKIITCERTGQRGPWSRFLHQGSAGILRIDRVINVNDEFTVLSRFFVAGEQAEFMESQPLDQLHGANFRIVLSDAFRLPVTNISHNVSIARASSDQAGTLRIGRADPLLRVEIAATAGTDVPFYFQELFCPPVDRKLSLPGAGRY